VLSNESWLSLEEAVSADTVRLGRME
jgi:hypothetical protein